MPPGQVARGPGKPAGDVLVQAGQLAGGKGGVSVDSNTVMERSGPSENRFSVDRSVPV